MSKYAKLSAGLLARLVSLYPVRFRTAPVRERSRTSRRLHSASPCSRPS